MPANSRKKSAGSSRVQIYQLFVRLFSNINETRKPDGTLAENGVGKFADIDDTALASLRDELGISHIWLTGILSQATGTAHHEIAKPADETDLLKGIAGSPYAVRDYGDVCADYAVNPEMRMEEFKALTRRIHKNGMRVLIDFVPNHVARSHQSNLVQFGLLDRHDLFFAPSNNFFWLQPDSPGGGPPLRLPTVDSGGRPATKTGVVLGNCNGIYLPELTEGRVTGNNAITWSPSINDWYETVKLNYGYDFTTGARHYPNAHQLDLPIPDTWKKMDVILAHWQSLGVDGFRCDMAHLVPPEFWRWEIARARTRDADVFFAAETYDDDPSGVSFAGDSRSVSEQLLHAGFDAVYDHGIYRALKRIYDGPAWANDLDFVLGVDANGNCANPLLFQRGLRYAENHDEVRLASNGNWGNVGMNIGRAVCGLLFGISGSPAMIYNGQEVGEPGAGAEGFSGDNGRTTIFDYWCMPEVAKWVNGGQFNGGLLNEEQHALRQFYGKLLGRISREPFVSGRFFPLNQANVHNEQFGRIPGEPASGHWLYAFVRFDPATKAWCLVVVNLHPREHFKDVVVQLTESAIAALRKSGDTGIQLCDEINGLPPVEMSSSDLVEGRLVIRELPPLTAGYFCKR